LPTSLTIGKLTEALAKAQGAFAHAAKDTKNEFFKSRYADLASVIAAAKHPLSDNGLSVSQVTDFDDTGRVFLITILSHTSGEWISGRYPIMPIKQDPQGFGSAITYARRYMFSAITGIAQDDDDGNAASTAKPAPQPKPPTLDDRYNSMWNAITCVSTIDDLEKVVVKGAVVTNEVANKDKEKHEKLINFISKRREELGVDKPE